MDHDVHPGWAKDVIPVVELFVLRQQSFANPLQDMHEHNTSACYICNRYVGFVLEQFLASYGHTVAHRCIDQQRRPSLLL